MYNHNNHNGESLPVVRRSPLLDTDVFLRGRFGRRVHDDSASLFHKRPVGMLARQGCPLEEPKIQGPEVGALFYLTTGRPYSVGQNGVAVHDVLGIEEDTMAASQIGERDLLEGIERG